MNSKMKNSLKSFSRKVAAVAVVASLSMSASVAYAATATPAPKKLQKVGEQSIQRYNKGELLTFTAGSISGGSGDLSCSLSMGNYWAVVQAASGPNDGNLGTIDCYLQYPSGSSVLIGTIPASNGQSTELLQYFLPFGEYKFIYYADVDDALEVQGFIYD